jgi:hypothetical protein
MECDICAPWLSGSAAAVLISVLYKYNLREISERYVRLGENCVLSNSTRLTSLFAALFQIYMKVHFSSKK